MVALVNSVLLFLSLPALYVTDDLYSCPFGHTKLNDGCFKYYRTPVTQAAAKAACESKNAKLIPDNTPSPFRGWIEGDVNNQCQYYMEGGVDRDCETPAMFTCYIPALKFTVPDDDPDFDPEKKYYCNETLSETLYRDKCYSKRASYKTAVEAATDCTSGGYKLSSRNVTTAGYHNGWVAGSFHDGRLTDTHYSLTPPALCVYVDGAGESLVADCRKLLKSLCYVSTSPCPPNHVQCADNGHCIGLSVTDKMSWEDSALSMHVCGYEGVLLDTRVTLASCSSAVKNLQETNLWVGGTLTESRVIQLNSGDNLTLAAERQCLRVSGNKVLLDSCTDSFHRYLCERGAGEAVSDEGGNQGLVLVLVLVPGFLVCVVLLLVYRKRGKQMCMSDSTAQKFEGRGTGLTIENPVMSELEEKEGGGEGREKEEENDYVGVTDV